MECNREELRITAGCERPEGVLLSAKKKSSPEARAPQHPQSASPAPIAEEFWHRASLSGSAHALPGISWSPQSSKRPISRSAFPRTNHLSRAPAESRKCAQEQAPSVPAPAGSISSIFFFRAPCPQLWKRWSSARRSVPAPNLQTCPAPPQEAASGPGGSLFGVAWWMVLGLAQSLPPPLLLAVGRNFARQVQCQDPVAILPAKNLEYHILALLQL